MKNKIIRGVALGFGMIGLVLVLYCVCNENESSYLLALALLCTTIGNFVNMMICKKQK